MKLKSELTAALYVIRMRGKNAVLFLNKQRFGMAFACSFPLPPLTDPHLQARALRFFMPDKSSTTMSGTRCEWSAAVKSSNWLWTTTWPKVSAFPVIPDMHASMCRFHWTIMFLPSPIFHGWDFALDFRNFHHQKDWSQVWAALKLDSLFSIITI